MKNHSLILSMVAALGIVANAAIWHAPAGFGLALLLAPVVMVTMLLSFRIKAVLAHTLNVVPVVISLLFSLWFGYRRGDGFALAMCVIYILPILIVISVILWVLAYWMRETEVKFPEDIRALRADMMRPKQPPTDPY